MAEARNDLVNAIVEICQKLDRKGWVANHDGNVSLCSGDRLLATPTAVSKADVTPEMVLTLDMEGKKVAGTGKPFSEIKLHLAAYRCREDVRAVVHAHPPFSMARGLVGGDFQIHVPEAVVSIGDVIPVAPYLFPGSPEQDRVVGDALCRCDVFMMAGNGVLSVGRDVKEAYLRMELLEHLLKIDYYTRAMGTVTPLPEGDKQKLLEKRASIGLGPEKVPPAPVPTGDQNALIKQLIAEELKNILKSK